MLKALRENGFKVTCYERRKQVGGLWAYTEDPSMTTALPCTFLLVQIGLYPVSDSASYPSPH